MTYIPYIFYLFAPLVYVLSHELDMWLSLFIIIPNWVAAVSVMNWVAVKTS